MNIIRFLICIITSTSFKQTLNTADETAVVQSAPRGVPSLLLIAKPLLASLDNYLKNLLKREGSLGSIAVFNKFYCHSLSSQARLAVNKHQTTNSDGQGFDKLLGTGPNIIKPLSVLSVLVAVKNVVSLVFALTKLINSLNRNLNEESVTLNKQDNLQT